MSRSRTEWLAVLALAAGCASPSLRAERDAAVRGGLAWLDAYVADDAAADALGIDGVAIFADLAASAADPEVRRRAGETARRLGRRLSAEMLSREALDCYGLQDLLLLLSLAEDLGVDPVPLRSRAREAFSALSGPDAVYGLPSLAPDAVARLTNDEVFDLLLGVYAVERAAAGGDGFGVRFGVRDLLAALRRRPYLTREEDPEPLRSTHRDHVYLATHVAYVLTDYGRLRLHAADAPWAIRYLARAFPGVLAACDVELVAEIVDVRRSLRLDETGDDIVREGTAFLLSAQRRDGSWGPGRAAGEPYFAVHHTWCAVMALEERAFSSGTPYERRLREFLR